MCMSGNVTTALGLGRSLVLTTLTAVFAVLPQVSALQVSEEDSVQRITLEQALEMFEQNNLELRVVAAERDRALGFAKQAKAHPNPVAAVSHEGLSESGRDYSESYFTLSQRLEWPG